MDGGKEITAYSKEKGIGPESGDLFLQVERGEVKKGNENRYEL